MEKNDELAKIAYEHRLYQSQLQEIQRQATSAQNAMMEVAATAAGLKAIADVGGGTLMGLGSGTFTAVSVRDPRNVVVEVGAGVFVEKTVDEAAATMEERRKRLEGILQKLGSSMEAVSQRLSALEQKAEAFG